MDETGTLQISQDRIREIHGNMLPEDRLLALTDLFKVFGDSTRLRILSALAHGEICVYDLSVILDMTQSAISHQLRILKQSRLVKSRRDGKMIYYSLDDDHVRSIISQGMEHVME